MRKPPLILSLLLGPCLFVSLAFAQEINPNDTITAEYIIATRTVPEPLGKFHASAGLGYYSTLNPGDFRIPVLGIDCSNGPSGFINLRNSFSQNFDAVIEVRYWGSVSEEYGLKMQLDVLSYGVGCRAVVNEFSKNKIYPFVQGNLYSITEKVTASFMGESDGDEERGFGFGIDVGIEIKQNRRFSIPVVFRYMYGVPADDISGFGFYAGISYNWGEIDQPMNDN